MITPHRDMNSLKFDDLYTEALKLWPDTISSKVIYDEDGHYRVPSLWKVYDEAIDIAESDSFFMYNMNWAIFTAFHTALKQRSIVSKLDLSVDGVREKFESDLSWKISEYLTDEYYASKYAEDIKLAQLYFDYKATQS